MLMSGNDNWVGRVPGDVPAGPERSNAGAGRLAHQIDHERIAKRAYEIYESHDRTDGHADDDWRQAEVEYAIRRANELAAIRHYTASTRTAQGLHRLATDASMS
jgi:Protein of unknown function (DUF2934)